MIKLTNQEIVAEAIQKTEKLLIESTNGKNYTNPADSFLDGSVNSQSLQKKVIGYNVTSFENVDEETKKLVYLE